MSNATPAAIRKGLRKVYGGTPLHARPALCETCSYATRVKGTAESEDYTYCSRVGGYDNKKLIDIKVVECSGYEDKRLPSLYHMEQMAWTVATHKNGTRIGFVSPQQLRKLSQRGDVERAAPDAPGIDDE